MPIRVVIADDHPTLLLGIRAVLEATGAMTVTAEARSPDALIKLLDRVACDAVVMDYLMPIDECTSVGLGATYRGRGVEHTDDREAGSTTDPEEGTSGRDGLYLLRRVRRTYPTLPIVVFTMLKEARLTAAVLRLGANAILCKSDPIDLLPRTLRLVVSGHLLMRPAEAMDDSAPVSCFPMSSQNQCLSKRLSRREAEVIRMLLAGRSMQEVAHRVGRSAKTISNQKRSAMQKLGVDNDIALARLAAETGFC